MSAPMPASDALRWRDYALALGLTLLFDYLGVNVSWTGWIMYLFPLPFCWMLVEDRPLFGWPILAAHLILFPYFKLRRREWRSTTLGDSVRSK